MERIEHNPWKRAVGPSITCNLIARVLITYHVKHTQSTAFEKKRLTFDRCRPHFVTFGLVLAR